MKQSKETRILTAILILIANISIAQQDAQYTQYMYNMSVVNPAYANDNNNLDAGLIYRSQWVSSVGAPSTVSFFTHSKLIDKLEGNISIVHDQIGDVVNDSNLSFDLAYVFPISEFSKLSLGVKTGISLYATNFNGFVYSDPLPDPLFSENLNKVFPIIGTGAYYFSKNFYFGMSIPNILKSKHLKENSGVFTEASEALHYFITSGYVFRINKHLKLKPSFMIKSVIGAPITLDLTSNILYNEAIEFGMAYRIDDGISALFNIKLNKTIRIGYAYDHTISNLGRFNSGTHEIMLLFNFFRLNKGYDKSPRFF